jgi:multiple sugar transport system substrate-binding protein
MLGGAILESRPAHPTNEFYWFPEYNSTVGVRALDFIKDHIDAGIEPQQKLLPRTSAVMLGGSWMPGEFPRNQWPYIGQKLGFIPMFPVRASGNDNATTMGEWLLSIPE